MKNKREWKRGEDRGCTENKLKSIRNSIKKYIIFRKVQTNFKINLLPPTNNLKTVIYAVYIYISSSPLIKIIYFIFCYF